MPRPASNLNAADPLVKIDDVSVVFDRTRVLRHIDLEIPRGQSLVIIGESGCGKTVLLKSIIGLIKPTSGTVSFDGRDLAKLDDQQLTLARTEIGFVFQNAALFDSLSVGQNVAFPLRQQGKLSEEEIREEVLSRLADVGLPSTVVSKKPVELSGGMRKRVGLARALVLKPKLILYDEPTTGLDPIMSDVINELIVSTRNQGHSVTSIIVTHDMHTARKVGDRVVMLYPVSRLDSDESQVIYDAPAAELDQAEDRRVRQFVRGEAQERLMELRQMEAARNSG